MSLLENSFISTKLNEPITLRESVKNFKFPPLKPLSVYSCFKICVEKFGRKTALVYKENGILESKTYIEYWNACHQAAKGFLKLGMNQSSCVFIMGFNSPQWMISLFGSIFAGGVACGVYSTNSVETCKFIFDDTQSRIVVVENNALVERIIACKSKGCKIDKIIQYSDKVEDSHDGLVISWDEFMNLYKDINDDLLRERIDQISPNKCATLIYTSGTTGNPKAAMLSHDNLYYASSFVIDYYGFSEFDRGVSYLPLSHIAAQLTDCYIPINTGLTLYFAEPDALKGSLVKTLNECKPTIFFGVPRVWEQMQEKLNLPLKNNLIKNENCKAMLGLNECKQFVAGAAPISYSTVDFFKNIGIKITQVYGLSESSGPHIFSWRSWVSDKNLDLSLGNVITPFSRTKIVDPDQDGNGEICIYGRHVFMGYLNNMDKTKEAIDNDGWLHTGDIGKIDEHGFLFITGRLKELLITAGGENIAPVPIENNIKMELSQLISNCMIVGDRKKFLIALVTLKSKLDQTTTASLDELVDEVVAWLELNNCSVKRVSEAIQTRDKLIYDTIENGIKRANQKAISRAAVIQKFIIIPRDFSLATGELTPTLKLRRSIVYDMYKDQIEQVYRDS